MEGRDALWAHPDLLPTATDLADPEAFVAESSSDEISDDLDISGLESGGSSETPDEAPGGNGDETGPDETGPGTAPDA
jgi:hypothetical protein